MVLGSINVGTQLKLIVVKRFIIYQKVLCFLLKIAACNVVFKQASALKVVVLSQLNVNVVNYVMYLGFVQIKMGNAAAKFYV